MLLQVKTVLLLRLLSHEHHSAIIVQYITDLLAVATSVSSKPSEQKSFVQLCGWIFSRIEEKRLGSPQALPALLCSVRYAKHIAFEIRVTSTPVVLSLWSGLELNLDVCTKMQRASRDERRGVGGRAAAAARARARDGAALCRGARALALRAPAPALSTRRGLTQAARARDLLAAAWQRARDRRDHWRGRCTRHPLDYALRYVTCSLSGTFCVESYSYSYTHTTFSSTFTNP